MAKITRREFIKSTGLIGAAVLASGGVFGSETDRGPDPANGEGNKQMMLTVALLQMESDGDNHSANLNKADRFCREAAAKGADIALMPEMWNIGYGGFEGTSAEVVKQWQSTAVAGDGEYVQHFVELARELGMAIAVTYLEKWQGAPRNSVSLIDRHGNKLYTYAKVHTCDFSTREASCTPGDDFFVAELDTAKGKVKVGSMICYDREHPESARILMLKGAELILTPNACTLDDLRINQFQTRAFENALGVAMANYPATHPGCNGRSVAFDAEGRRLAEAGGEEGIHLAQFDLNAIREYRKHTIWGDAFRRPHRYGELVEFDEKNVFARHTPFGDEFDAAKR